TLDGRALASTAAVTIEASTVTAPGLTTGVDVQVLSDGYHLSQNFPNPFNPSTTISYQLPVTSQVILTITDLLGRELSVLVNEVQAGGNHQIVWDVQNFPSGIYNYRLEAGSNVSVKQLTLVK
ncbi:MAG: T9SS type A sorting domain-containing protein, partial [Candidatus Marinimicrobia bacterium]|nr:T9SS type A sorting domain-containing protein [Candidatus Neomarinimicrobiota bacterium]